MGGVRGQSMREGLRTSPGDSNEPLKDSISRNERIKQCNTNPKGPFLERISPMYQCKQILRNIILL